MVCVVNMYLALWGGAHWGIIYPLVTQMIAYDLIDLIKQKDSRQAALFTSVP